MTHAGNSNTWRRIAKRNSISAAAGIGNPGFFNRHLRARDAIDFSNGASLPF
jgi:hypothetical protein